MRGWLAFALSALYPVITILLALIFLGEHVSAKHALGIVCAITATLLFAV